ncbi:hypothetical protein [Alteromonas sp. BMJM2]|uniref:hypothetical protein n=1 Tax=Alteromonas sp. BMJM2 TaxID=2954241 RepID=UPI0022B2BC56|nr:hypothetical protein [Alteromonas sp. BMJM2]
MQQEDINKREWKDKNNWSESTVFGIYFSKKDSRIWVPKPNAIPGWTLNLAHFSGVAIFFAIICVTMLVSGLIGFYLAIES